MKNSMKKMLIMSAIPVLSAINPKIVAILAMVIAV